MARLGGSSGQGYPKSMTLLGRIFHDAKPMKEVRLRIGEQEAFEIDHLNETGLLEKEQIETEAR